ncbi:MAG: hypothetical protein ACR2N3_05185 [Pyrinomonadaceae bacterium]
MRNSKFFLIFSFILIFCAVPVFAQENPIVKTDLSQAEINRIVKNFTTKEGEFRESLKDYVFNRSAVIQTIGFGGQVSGEYRRDSFMTLSPEGVRFEKILFAPVPTLVDLNFTPQDLEDLGGVNQFALDPSVANLYNFNYVGKQKIDELNLYVFDVSPKIIPDPKKTKQRFFTGRIWVDDRDLQIVKSKGKAIPEDKNNKYPVVETWRENVDGKYWFPSYSSSDDELVFGSGQVVKLRMRVKYTDYKQGRSEVRVLDDDTAAQPAPTPKKP